MQNSLLQTGISCGDERSDEIFRSENAFFASDIRDVARNGNDKIKALIVSGSDRTVDYIKEYYGGMIGRGATAFWEDFDISWLDGSGRIDEIPAPDKKDLHADYGQFCYKGLRHSLCHGWSSGVLPFFIEEIVGLKILEPGFKKVAVRPDPGSLKYIAAKIPTPYGVMSIEVKNGRTDVVVPNGITFVK